MGLNLRGESSGSVELNAPSSGGDVNITVPGQEGTLLIENSSGITSSTSLLVGSGVTITSGGIDMAVGVTTIGGALEIFHDGLDSFVHGNTNTRQLKIRGQEVRVVNEANSEIMAKFIQDGTVELYHNNSKKLETTSTGVVVTGILTATSVSGAGFPSGTLMLFQQTAAPTGWTKQTTHNNKALRVVSGSVTNGGSDSFTTVFGTSKTTASHTLTESEIPAHTHSYSTSNGQVAGSGLVTGNVSGSSNTGSTGGGGGHSHDLSNFDLEFVDLIIASKDA